MGMWEPQREDVHYCKSGQFLETISPVAFAWLPPEVWMKFLIMSPYSLTQQYSLSVPKKNKHDLTRRFMCFAFFGHALAWLNPCHRLSFRFWSVEMDPGLILCDSSQRKKVIDGSRYQSTNFVFRCSGLLHFGLHEHPINNVKLIRISSP